MRRPALLLSLPLLLLLVACGGPAGTDPAGDAAPDWPDFHPRAAQVARDFSAVLNDRWRTGFVPLQEPTVLVGEAAFTEATRVAYGAGWYRAQVVLPTTVPPPGTVRFPTGTLTVPLVGAVEAYRQLDRGDPPPCPGGPQVVPPTPAAGDGPDSAVSSPADPACVPLTVTAATLGTVTLRTSRGEATVPAWLFTVRELAAVVARLAVAPAAVDELPEVPELPWQAADLLAVQDLTRVDGARLGYRVGARPCDGEVTPLVAEFDDAVVLAGGVPRPPDGAAIACVDMLELRPVTVDLAAPLGDRPVLSAFTGRPLLLDQAGS